jgi:5'-3' exonuclease
MINKIILEEKPEYMIVAFDKGKTFRHNECETYKGGRQETPNELKVQFPIAKQLLDCMGIKYYEIDNYEADDIIGTFAEYCNKDSEYIGTIISSDKDLLQLISSDVDIKLLKSKDYIRYNEKTFFEDYGIEPKKVVDLKALMGDSSDNIPGVKGIGEKTALKLLTEHGSLDGIYENIDSIKGALKDKLLNDKENAYLSYHLATIVRNVPLEINIDDIIYLGPNHEKLAKMYEELEFYSFLKKDIFKTEETKDNMEIKILENIEDLKFSKDLAIYLEILGSNYHNSEILGMALYNDEDCVYVKKELINDVICKINHLNKYTYDLKKVYVYKSINNTCKLNHKDYIEEVPMNLKNIKTGYNKTIRVFHCTKCDKYFITIEAITKYTENYYMPQFKCIFNTDLLSELNEISLLGLYGYNVREDVLSNAERHTIIDFALKHNIMSSQEIISLLEFNIRIRKNNRSMQKACKKWHDDIQYIYNRNI